MIIWQLKDPRMTGSIHPKFCSHVIVSSWAITNFSHLWQTLVTRWLYNRRLKRKNITRPVAVIFVELCLLDKWFRQSNLAFVLLTRYIVSSLNYCHLLQCHWYHHNIVITRTTHNMDSYSPYFTSTKVLKNRIVSCFYGEVTAAPIWPWCDRWLLVTA